LFIIKYFILVKSNNSFAVM